MAVATLVSDVAGGGRASRRLVLRDGVTTGTLGSDRLDAAVRDDTAGWLQQGRTGIVWLGRDGERRVDDVAVFIASYVPPPRMIVFGAIDFAAAVAQIGSFLGYRVTSATRGRPSRRPRASPPGLRGRDGLPADQ